MDSTKNFCFDCSIELSTGDEDYCSDCTKDYERLEQYIEESVSDTHRKVLKDKSCRVCGKPTKSKFGVCPPFKSKTCGETMFTRLKARVEMGEELTQEEDDWYNGVYRLS